MSSISFDFNNNTLNIFLFNVRLFSFTDDAEENKRELHKEMDYLVKRIIHDSSFSNTKIVAPEWLSLLCYQLDKTVPLKKGKWLDRFNQMLMEINKEIVTTKDYLFLDLK